MPKKSEKGLFMYSLGDKVVYPLHGVGVIDSIEDKTVLGEKTVLLCHQACDF